MVFTTLAHPFVVLEQGLDAVMDMFEAYRPCFLIISRLRLDCYFCLLPTHPAYDSQTLTFQFFILLSSPSLSCSPVSRAPSCVSACA